MTAPDNPGNIKRNRPAISFSFNTSIIKELELLISALNFSFSHLVAFTFTHKKRKTTKMFNKITQNVQSDDNFE